MPVRLNGSTSGYVELAAPAVAGSTVLTLPTDSIQPGMILTASQSFSAASTVSVNNCFTSAYDLYLVMLRITAQSTSPILRYRLRASGADNTSALYSYSYAEGYGGGAAGGNAPNQTSGVIGYSGGGNYTAASIELFGPALAAPTLVSCNVNRGSDLGAGITAQLWASSHNVSTAFDGITVYPDSGTFTGSLYVYGYRKA